MADLDYTPFVDVYAYFLSKITDDMYMELTPQDTYKILRQLLLSALPKFEFPRQSLDYKLRAKQDQEVEEYNLNIQHENVFVRAKEDQEVERGNLNIQYGNAFVIDNVDTDSDKEWVFINKLTNEQINIISTYMIVQWIGQQLASVENTRMKYSGSDFKFTSQANHMQKLLQMKKDYEREGFHLQRLYKRRIKNKNGIYRSTLGKIMEKPAPLDQDKIFYNVEYKPIDNLVFKP